jgi:predicted site-specific integrase-resolvase
MNFELPEHVKDTAAALRAAEPQAPKQMKALLIQAATELDTLRHAASDVSSELSAASNFRVSAMDTNSRAEEVARNITAIMRSSVERLRAALGD